MFLKRNASTILTCIGGAGVIFTTVTAVKATPKAMTLIEESKHEKGRELTTYEVIKTAGRTYIPTILVGIGTLSCIFGASVLSKRQQASLMAAYTLIDTSFKEYKNKVKELYGEETHQEIVNSIMVEKAEDMYFHSAYFATSCDLPLEEDRSEPRLFYDEYSNRYFETTIEQVLSAEYHLNRNYVLRGYAYLNELYEFLGLSATEYGSVLGWAPLDEGMYWIEFNHRKVVMDDGLECYILELPFEPRIDFDEY